MTFTLRSLLLAFVVIASALGTLGPSGLGLGILIVAGLAFVRSVRPTTVLSVVALIIGGWIIIWLFSPVRSAAREVPLRVCCRNNLRQIGLALHNYESAHGCFPPAFVPGPDGKPWHSWRVLILPYLERRDLYAKYNFNEPWDGPNNRNLAASFPRPSDYVCPSSRAAASAGGDTSYLAIVGPKAAWAGPKSLRFDDFGDGTCNTILVMEAAGLGVHWMEPRDLDFETVAASGAQDPKTADTTVHTRNQGFFYIAEDGRSRVLCADASVHTLPWGTPGEALVPLLTANGGETADLELLPFTDDVRLNWPRCLSLAVLVISTLLLWWSTRPRPAATENG